MSELDESPGGNAFLAKSLDELAAGDEQLFGVPGGTAARLRLLRPGSKRASPVFGVSKIVGGEQSTQTYYDEHEARSRFAELVDEIK